MATRTRMVANSITNSSIVAGGGVISSTNAGLGAILFT